MARKTDKIRAEIFQEAPKANGVVPAEKEKSRLKKMNLRQLAHSVSYAGIIRIRFQGFKARLPCLSRENPSAPYDCVRIVSPAGTLVKKGLFRCAGNMV